MEEDIALSPTSVSATVMPGSLQLTRSGSLSQVKLNIEEGTDEGDLVEIELSPRPKTRFYAGDLIAIKSTRAQEWTPIFGTVLGNQNPYNPRLPHETQPYAVVTVEPTTEETHQGDSSKSPSSTTRTPGSHVEVKVDEEDEGGSGSSISKAILPRQPRLKESHGFEKGFQDKIFVHFEQTNQIRQVEDSEVRIADRVLFRGVRVKNNNGVKGTIVDTSTKLSLQIVGTNHVIENASLGSLNPVSSLVRGIEIKFCGWVGIITNVGRKVFFRLDGGKKFYIDTKEGDGFMKTDPYWGPGTPCPGIRSKFSPALLKTAVWDSGAMRFLWKWFPPMVYLYSYTSATTVRSEISEIKVKWITPAPGESPEVSDPLHKPPEVITFPETKRIEILGLPSSETLGINSVRVYRMRSTDAMTSYGAWFNSFRARYMDYPPEKYSNFFIPSLSAVGQMAAKQQFEVPVKVLFRQSWVEILWDNGETSKMLANRVPIICSPVEDEDFLSGRVVTHVRDKSSNKYGIVQQSEEKVLKGTRTLLVRWILPESETEDGESLDLGVKEESVYDIRAHSDITMYQRGTLVFLKREVHGVSAGAVSDLDVRTGKMLVTSASVGRTVHVYPHLVIPFNKRCYWNFFSREWVEDELIPPPIQLDASEPPGILRALSTTSEVIPVTLNANNNAEVLVKPWGRTEWKEPKWELLNEPSVTHRYHDSPPNTIQGFNKTMYEQLDYVRNHIPDGIWIRTYLNRSDLLSVMMVGPQDTPFEDGLFMFDLMFLGDGISQPPKIYFVAFTTPANLSHFVTSDGTFCTSRIDWNGPQFLESKTNVVLYTLNTIRDLLFNREPFFLEDRAGFGTKMGALLSRAFNEKVLIGTMTSLHEMALRPHDPWRDFITEHLSAILPRKLTEFKNWLSEDDAHDGMTRNPESTSIHYPTYPLLPVSKGFRIALEQRMDALERLLPGGGDDLEPPKAQQKVKVDEEGLVVEEILAYQDNGFEFDMNNQNEDSESNVNVNVVPSSKGKVELRALGENEPPEMDPGEEAQTELIYADY